MEKKGHTYICPHSSLETQDQTKNSRNHQKEINFILVSHVPSVNWISEHNGAIVFKFLREKKLWPRIL
jgi:hypothetical protein